MTFPFIDQIELLVSIHNRYEYLCCIYAYVLYIVVMNTELVGIELLFTQIILKSKNNSLPGRLFYLKKKM